MMSPAAALKCYRILVIDDNAAIHDDIRKILCGRPEPNLSYNEAKSLLFGQPHPRPQRVRFEIESAYQGQEGLQKVQESMQEDRPFALAFVDVRMPPGWDGVETISRLWKESPELQIVICTAYSDYSWEAILQQLGKSESMLILKKPFDNIEVLQLAHALTEKWQLELTMRRHLEDLDRTVNQRTLELRATNEQLKNEIAERALAEEAVRKSEERFSKAFVASPIPLAIQSLQDGRFVDVNLGFQELTGYGRSELVGRTPLELGIWDKYREGAPEEGGSTAQKTVRNLPFRLHTKTREPREVYLSLEVFELGSDSFHLILVQDVTEQQRLETQLRQSQKMEAVGQLAAGVAHDFNNILQIIQGYSGMLLANGTLSPSDKKPLQRIMDATTRAASLVRQLLTFSRKTSPQMQGVDIRSTLATISEMLPRLLPENIVVSILPATNLPLVNADPGMMEQALMNLALNARDAMPEGGWLTISADEVELSSRLGLNSGDTGPNRFLCLSVADTGCGMPPDVLAHIFEPFFTTKSVGKGTGLGLATVYGIAKQHGGWVEAQSQPGKGSKFRVYIPSCYSMTRPEAAPAVQPAAQSGHETILVVEDELELREFLVEILAAHGYRIIDAGSGPEALDRWSEHRDQIQLLLTDMVMPGGLTGRQLAERLLSEAPSLKVIYSSGYSPGMAGNDLAVMQDRNFIAKPYTAGKLLGMIRDCLDERL
jgi:two-component system, cell cycle sensor histidine kinase and response regulator CckA